MEQPIYPSFTKDICFEIKINEKYIEIEREIVQILDKAHLWSRVECLDIYKDSEVLDKKELHTE
jgi:hypothetical protein